MLKGLRAACAPAHLRPLSSLMQLQMHETRACLNNPLLCPPSLMQRPPRPRQCLWRRWRTLALAPWASSPRCCGVACSHGVVRQQIRQQSKCAVASRLPIPFLGFPLCSPSRCWAAMTWRLSTCCCSWSAGADAAWAQHAFGVPVTAAAGLPVAKAAACGILPTALRLQRLSCLPCLPALQGAPPHATVDCGRDEPQPGG